LQLIPKIKDPAYLKAVPVGKLKLEQSRDQPDSHSPRETVQAACLFPDRLQRSHRYRIIDEHDKIAEHLQSRPDV
jgi:hypothetical protein